MKRVLRWTSIAGLAAMLAGCAGGWRNGAPPGETATASASAGAASPSAPSNANVPGGSISTANGAVFVWKGGGGSVAVAGEFNAWNTSADPLAKQADGVWTLTKTLPPGRYMYKFVIDGSTWKEDPTAKETADDGYGGKNAVVVVGGAGGTAPAAGTAAPSMAVKANTPSARPPQVTADGVIFTFAGNATTLFLAGEFNSWSPTADPMQKQADGTWSITKKLAPGTYAYKYVVNGTVWKHDEANPNSADDGFGAKNSVVTVP